MDSISTLLLYADSEVVYRFLHVLRGRVQTVDGRSIHLLHTDGHTDRVRSTVSQLFDVVVDVRERDDGRREGRRLDDTGGTDWRPLEDG